MMDRFTKWDNSLNGTLQAGPMGVPLSEVLLYIKRENSEVEFEDVFIWKLDDIHHIILVVVFDFVPW